MGIPRFKRKLTDLMLLLEYVIYVEKGFFHKVTDKVEGLYLDANSIIHVATQYLEFDGLSPVKMEQCCQLVVFLIRTIVNHYKPRGVLYIAVDGVVPMTKIQQQRERRYESAMTTKSLEYTGSFITPGTLFMQALNEHLIQFVDDKGSLDMHVDVVIYSSYLVPGEGEHKIMDYIRSRSLKPENGANVIFGNDADLILLALGND
jgi:5'-3' exoribonuclease 1